MTLGLSGTIHGDSIGGGSRKGRVRKDVASSVDETEQDERKRRRERKR